MIVKKGNAGPAVQPAGEGVNNAVRNRVQPVLGDLTIAASFL
jgi:hypothetical protein